jgi:hypothetical protein
MLVLQRALSGRKVDGYKALGWTGKTLVQGFRHNLSFKLWICWPTCWTHVSWHQVSSSGCSLKLPILLVKWCVTVSLNLSLSGNESLDYLAFILSVCTFVCGWLFNTVLVGWLNREGTAWWGSGYNRSFRYREVYNSSHHGWVACSR